MNLNGYVKLHRKMMNWKWKNHPPTFCLFVHLLLTASFSEASEQGVQLEPGQVIISRNKLAKETGLTEDQTRRALANLQKTGEIILSTSRGCKATVATIQNWPKYQGELGAAPSLDDSESFDNQGSHGANNMGPPQVKQKKKTAPSSTPSSDPSTDPNTTPRNGQPIIYKNKEIRKKNKDIIPFGEFVKMEQAEYDRLVDRYGKAFADKCIEVLDNYKGASGKKYASDYRAVLSWVYKRVSQDYPGLLKPKQQATTTNQPEYDPLAEWGGTL